MEEVHAWELVRTIPKVEKADLRAIAWDARSESRGHRVNSAIRTTVST